MLEFNVLEMVENTRPIMVAAEAVDKMKKDANAHRTFLFKQYSA